MRLTLPRLRLDFETARDADPFSAWGTIALVVVSAFFSIQRFQGADYDALISSWERMPGGAWTLFTCTLLHGGWLHLAFNMYWTSKMGILLEAMLGLVPLVLLVLFLAVVSSGAQWAVSGPCVGLSGIGYGFFGLLWALDRWHPRCRGVLDRRLAEMFGLWFLLCIAASWTGTMPVANTAHAVGFLGGAFTGWALSVSGPARLLRAGSLGGLAALVALGITPGVRHVLNRSEAYEYELFDRGYRALAAGELNLARELYLELVDRTPGAPDAWHNLGIAHRGLGDHELAADAFETSERLSAERDGGRDPGLEEVGW